jgi:integrase
MEGRVLAVFGRTKVSALEVRDLLDLADQLLADGHEPSTIRNTFMGLRGLYRRAVIRGDVALNPTAGRQLPAVRGRRDRIASVSEADMLLTVVPERDRAVWATAFLAGLRRGELMALDVGHAFDTTGVASLIEVERSCDPVAGAYISPKSHAGTRRVPVTEELRVTSRRTCSGWAETQVSYLAALRQSRLTTEPSRYERRRRGEQPDSRRSHSTKPDIRTRAFSLLPESTQKQ